MLGRFRPACAGLLLSALVTFAGAADGPIRLPVAPIVPTPMPAPVPPGSSLSLTGGQWYVIECDVKCAVRSYPRGMVKVTEEAGPLRLKGVFAGGGKVETRTYKGPVLYVVEATGKGTVDLEVVPFGFKSEAEIVGTSLQVDAAAGDCPDDGKKKDEDKKDEKKDPPPAVETAAWAIVIEETMDRNTLPLEQSRLLGDVTFWTGLKASGMSYRMYDKDSPDAKAKNYLDMVAGVKLPALLSLDKTGKKLRAVPLPTTAAKVREELGVK